jgi:hypothetical protein
LNTTTAKKDMDLETALFYKDNIVNDINRSHQPGIQHAEQGWYDIPYGGDAFYNWDKELLLF